MSAKLLPGALPGNDMPARACEDCGQPPGRHDDNGCSGECGKRGSEPRGSLPRRPGTPITAGSRRTRILAMLRPGIRSMHREIAMAVFLDAIDSAARLDHKCGLECLTGCSLPVDPEHSSLFFCATADQVRAVRAFARARLAGHPARDDAVLVASEISANSVAHSASGQEGGWFLAHVTEVSATHAAVLITERRGPAEPEVINAGPDSESGRGLAIVKSLSCFFRVSGGSNVRHILAVVPADPLAGDVRRCHAGSALRIARRAARRHAT